MIPRNLNILSLIKLSDTEFTLVLADAGLGPRNVALIGSWNISKHISLRTLRDVSSHGSGYDIEK